MNHDKKGLKRLLDGIVAGEVGRLVVTDEDRLLRFGAELMFAVCAADEVGSSPWTASVAQLCVGWREWWPMADQQKKRAKRSGIAARFDEITLAAFTALLIATIAATITLGVPTVEERIGCGLNDLVKALLAYPRPCR